MADQKRYFIPAWILEDKELSSGDKLVLCILSTRSTPIPGTIDRASYRIGPGEIADTLGYSYLQVGKILKKLEGSLIKKIEGGYRLLSPDSDSFEDVAAKDEETNATSKEPPAPAKETVAAYEAVNLFDGVWTWEECVRVLRSRKVCLADLRLSYERMDVCHPGRANLWALLVKSEDMLKEKGLPDTHMFGQGQE